VKQQQQKHEEKGGLERKAKQKPIPAAEAETGILWGRKNMCRQPVGPYSP
jgi:hypothetical protein